MLLSMRFKLEVTWALQAFQLIRHYLFSNANLERIFVEL